ncbi:trefoil factor 1 isoform X1 [Cervus elaphus]|uniref:trefoil factor 1 isoform X1 n=1 Tax=Cervus elaphus TaxID=9860 RepID=UPI001CC2BBAD|nr:trefoil factor 1 isoform X1 [Cervus elaphus]
MEPKVIYVVVLVFALALGSLAQSETETCQVEPHQRQNCGYSGITAKDCEEKGCCFDNTSASFRRFSCGNGIGVRRTSAWYQGLSSIAGRMSWGPMNLNSPPGLTAQILCIPN